MKSGLAHTLRSRSFAVLVLLGFCLLLYLAARSSGGKAPAYRDSVPLPTPAQSPAPVAKLGNLFAPAIWPKMLVDTTLPTPFFTTHFIPAPTPTAPAPTTRKIEITYLGYYESAGSPKHVIVKLADKFVTQPVGGNVSTNWLVAQATMNLLTLTNVAAETNLLPLNAKKEIEVPIQ